MEFHIRSSVFRIPVIITGMCCVILILLWLPGLRYPVVSDTVIYAQLGRSFWEQGTYMLDGVAHAKYLPIHAILSYPLTAVFGVHLGMHLSTLLGGMALLITLFFLMRQVVTGRMRAYVPAMVVAAVLFHPAFLLMSMVGSADLLFATLFLLSLLFFLRAEDDPRWYLGAGTIAGIASLTRYNGLPLFLLFVGWVLWKRRQHLRDPRFWLGLWLGLGLVSLWFIRNTVAFGNPFASGYTGELEQESDGPLAQILSNIFYYSNPVHNVFPFFFVFGVAGVIRHARKYLFLILAILAALPLSLIWWVQAIRFLFPAWVLLLFFAVLAIVDLLRWSRWSLPVIAGVFLIGLAMQSLSICLYTYGGCNAWFDRTIGIFPKNMHLSSEGFYTWGLARDYIVHNAEPNSTVQFEYAGTEQYFRPDIRITTDRAACPVYRITQRPEAEEEVLFQTEDQPVTAVVVRVACR